MIIQRSQLLDSQWASNGKEQARGRMGKASTIGFGKTREEDRSGGENISFPLYFILNISKFIFGRFHSVCNASNLFTFLLVPIPFPLNLLFFPNISLLFHLFKKLV